MRPHLARSALTRSLLSSLLCASLAALTPVPAQKLGAPDAGSRAHFEHCQSTENEAARLRCFEPTAPGATVGNAEAIESAAASSWRLIHTPNPLGGREAVSVIRTADFSHSDLNFAGLLIRCGDDNTVEVLFAVIQPFPPRSHPKVTLTTASTPMEFAASVIPPGLLVRLPNEAAALVDGPWRSASALRVALQDDQTTLHGTVPLSGLAGALVLLRSNCPAP